MSIHWIGNTSVYFSLAASLLGIGAFFFGAKFQKENWIRLGRGIAYFNFYAITLASLGMIYALLTNDFSVSYVAKVGARETPRFYAAISLWSSLEGSILLWGWILSGYTALCLYRYRNQFEELIPFVGVTLLSICFFFYLVLAVPANPFGLVDPVPPNGPGPNPLLQNHWLMGLHPPMLYLGYVGMSVPFAFAVASMVTGKMIETWVDAIRLWILLAWGFLTAAIILGGWWSYAVLGWGGYWAWDPVENASFMPWLTATAFLHSIMVQQKRGMLKIWNLFLILTTFLLTLLGTFLTRSGILESVHSFTESLIGHYFLICISAVLAVCAGLLIWKRPKFETPGKLDQPLCRESVFLLNNLLLVSFCFVVLLGTLYPLIAEAFRGVRVTVGEPFFNQMSIPFALGLILLMGLGAAIPWKRADGKMILKLLRWPLVLAVVAIGLAYLLGIRKGIILTTLSFSTFSLAIMLLEMIPAFLKNNRLFSLKPRRYGGFLVHIGILIIALGIALSGSYQKEVQASLLPGDFFKAGKYRVQFQRLLAEEKPQRFEVIALINVFEKEKMLGELRPKLNFYPQQREPIGSPSVRSSVTDDLYLTLMAFNPHKREATLRAILTPGVSWIWGGGGIIVIGVLIAGGLGRRES